MARKSNDQKLIEEFPGKTPKELLALGLSQGGYETLLSQEETATEIKAGTSPAEPTAEPTPAQPTVERQNVAVPRLQAAPEQYNGDMVVLVGPDGSTTPMTRKAAERFTRGGRNADYQIR